MTSLNMIDHMHFIRAHSRNQSMIFNKAVKTADELDSIYHELCAAKAYLLGEFYGMPEGRVGYPNLTAVYEHVKERTKEVEALNIELTALKERLSGGKDQGTEVLREIMALAGSVRPDPIKV